MEWWLLCLLLFGGMLVLMFLGMNIPFSLGIMAVIGIFVTFRQPTAGFVIVINEAYLRGTSFLILGVPLFILLSEIILAAGISKDAYESMSRLFCRVPGSLGVATTSMATMFAALTGSSLANAAIIGRVAVPEMTRHGYDKGLAAGVVVGGGALGILIPPSLPMIFYAMFSEESVSKLFMAGLIPGLVASLMMILYVVTLAKLKPAMAPAGNRVRFSDAMRTSYRLIPLAILIVTMFGAFYFGVATTTEIGAVAAFIAFLIGLAYKRLGWQNVKQACIAAGRTTVMIMWILIPALAFGTVLAYGKVTQNLAQWVIDLPVSPTMILIAINVLLFILGCILETGAIQMVIWPILIVVAQALGFNLIWFAVILLIQMEIGQITPPVAIILFAMKAIAPDIPLKDIYRGVIPYVIILLAVVILVMVFPQLALWLPMGGK